MPQGFDTVHGVCKILPWPLLCEKTARCHKHSSCGMCEVAGRYTWGHYTGASPCRMDWTRCKLAIFGCRINMGPFRNCFPAQNTRETQLLLAFHADKTHLYCVLAAALAYCNILSRSMFTQCVHAVVHTEIWWLQRQSITMCMLYGKQVTMPILPRILPSQITNYILKIAHYILTVLSTVYNYIITVCILSIT